MSPSRARAALVIAAIAVGSAVAGAGIDRWGVTHGPRRGRGGGQAGILSAEAATRRRTEMLERMTKDLKLTPAQRAGIDSIMERTDSALRVVRVETQPRVRQIFDSSRAAISARLDSAQRVKFLRERLEPGRRRE
jgi:Spy/CpxP family protein refolding chaperone